MGISSCCLKSTIKIVWTVVVSTIFYIASVLKSSPRRSPRREARRGELISPGGPQAKRT
ncbi:unnamed protein product [Ilex paraguariensis]|uniref:Uncharacterized protein n=1 Tax=Ilex paraguariensis TaxID=185542 RepID=A0ABC8QL43_9AQUA